MRNLPLRSPEKSRIASIVIASIEPLTSSLPSLRNIASVSGSRHAGVDRPAASDLRTARLQVQNCARSGSLKTSRPPSFAAIHLLEKKEQGESPALKIVSTLFHPKN